ncbi:hypothetical protein [Halorubrum kocurii]|uniref:Uncharacterized protein n=1 Tax=Halorubrum kocurii JCM 14978 TaxID=1230456 RepID=M0NTH6_9EURY|nr:hypothetical protein [Halorubrum kocurii]EMA59930.1 hypothetical protein C468_14098 [Halorubrum kocurii JCM 14978]
MSSSGDTYVEQAEGTGVSDAIRRVIVSPLLAVAAGISGLIATGFDQIGEVVGALGDLREFITAIVADGPIVIVEAGADATAAELGEFGVAAFAVGIGMIAAGWVVWTTVDPDVPLLDSLLPWR